MPNDQMARLMKVLIVDDNRMLAESLALFVQTLGYESVTLTQSALATEKFIEYRPDIVVLDVLMPVKDGITVLDEMLQTGLPSRIILTSGVADVQRRLALRWPAGVEKLPVTVLHKPYSLDALVAALDHGAVPAEATAAVPGIDGPPT